MKECAEKNTLYHNSINISFPAASYFDALFYTENLTWKILQVLSNFLTSYTPCLTVTSPLACCSCFLLHSKSIQESTVSPPYWQTAYLSPEE